MEEVRMRRRRTKAGRHAARRAAAWFARPTGRLATVGALTVGVVVMVTPANSAAKDLVSHLTGGFNGGTVTTSSTAEQLTGTSTAAVGALFTTSNGKLGSHFCTASVVHSPHGDLAVTAAHCVTGMSGVIVFAPAYHTGTTPYGTWQVTKVYADKAWTSG